MEQEDNNWKRHPELYLSDGTIILLADSMLFRVYAGLLATQSSVFAKLIQSNNGEIYDGCVFLRLHDDPKDVAYFLKATMGLCHFEREHPMSYPMASAILRLSSKYMIQFLRRQAIQHFGRIVPQSYNELDKLESYLHVFGIFSSDQPHPFQLLSLFRECQLTSFLPWKYYVVAAYGIETILQGETTADNGKKVYLNASDTRIAILGWNSLCAMTRKIRNDTIMSRAKDCQTLYCCGDAMRLAWLKKAADCVGSHAIAQWSMFTFLAGGQSVSPKEAERDFVFNNGRPCQACTKLWLKKEESDRSEIWSKLPSMFDLPDWQTLKQEEEL